MIFRANVEGDGGLPPINAVCHGVKPQVVLTGDVSQLPVDAVVDRKDLAVEVDSVEVFGTVLVEPRQLGWKRREPAELRLVGTLFELVFLSRILCSHRLEPSCETC